MEKCMATMWPREFPEPYKSDPLRRAERIVFDNLRNHLSADFDVFWSRSWSTRKNDSTLQDGECDFVLIHPSRGFCVLEVKGGSVKADPQTSTWTSTGSGGKVHTIHDPFNQSAASKHVLLEEFKKILKGKGIEVPFIPNFHGVVFPDVSKNNAEYETLKSPRALIAFREDLGLPLVQWISSLMPQGFNNPGFQKYAYPVLKNYLEEHFSFPMSLDARLQEEEALMESLTDQQELVLDSLTDQLRIRILGGAGTGKTVLAMREAQRLVEAGYRTALVCYNRGLSHHIRRQMAPLLQNQNFHVSTLHSLLWQGTKLENPNEYTLPSPNRLQASMAQGKILPFDAIIVDEGQDFVHKDWWTCIDRLLTGPKILRVFWDSNQKVYQGPSVLPDDIQTNPVYLNRVLRNTKHIWETAEPFYSGREVMLLTPEGLPVHREETPSIARAASHLNTLLDAWMKEGMSCKEISVLCRDESVLEKIKTALGKQTFSICSCEEQGQDALTFDTIRRFKGLESPGVILIADPKVAQDPELMYVGITRARSRLSILHMQEAS